MAAELPLMAAVTGGPGPRNRGLRDAAPATRIGRFDEESRP
jgi:hypothetical protein